MNADETRHSRANDAELITDPGELAEQEARNGLRQFDLVIEIVEHHLSPERPFRLRPSTVLHLNRNIHWATRSALHLAAYIMWRLNWIHPFTDGNGRTSRAASYLVLCLRLGYVLPGRRTIPDQISADRSRYYKALESADNTLVAGNLDLAPMEQLLSDLLAIQLAAIHDEASH